MSYLRSCTSVIFGGNFPGGSIHQGGGVKKFGKSFEHFLEISGKFVYKEAIKSVFWGVVGRFISKISKDTFFGRKIHLPTAKKFEIHLPRCRDPLPQINTVLHPKSIILIPLALTNSWKYVTDSKLFSPKMTDSVNFLKKWWIGEQIGILNFSAYILKSLLWVRLKIYLQFFKKKNLTFLYSNDVFQILQYLLLQMMCPITGFYERERCVKWLPFCKCWPI